MTTRLFATVLIAASVLAAPRAADQVTFHLTNGDSVSGDIATSSEASPSMPKGELNLERGTEERSFGLEMVAVIAWVTDRPSVDELRALPDDGHVVVLRNGTSQQGRMVQLRPEVLRWLTMRGQTEEIRVTNIARLYLNADRARAIFNYRPDKPAQPAGGAAPPPDSWGNKKTGTISVAGNQAWTDVGLDVRNGDRLTFGAAGQIRLSANRTHISSPAGAGATRSPNYPVPTAPVGALIARVGDGAPFLIGMARTSFTMQGNGRLYLGINDDDVRDNSGAYQVNIQRN
jgi:hypothetical protein